MKQSSPSFACLLSSSSIFSHHHPQHNSPSLRVWCVTEMGNCHTNDAVAAILQHPDGHAADRFYWPTSAEDVMRSHPNHYVALITLCNYKDSRGTTANGIATNGGAAVKLTRVRLLKHKDMLQIGQVYRLISSQEVTKALRARKHEKIRKAQQQKERLQQSTRKEDGGDSSEGILQEMDQAARHGREWQRSYRHWQPSLQSISEVGS